MWAASLISSTGDWVLLIGQIALVYSLKLTLVAFVLASFTLVQGTTAAAASGYSLFGDAEIVSGGNPGNAAQLRSDTTPGYGGVDFATTAGMTVKPAQQPVDGLQVHRG